MSEDVPKRLYQVSAAEAGRVGGANWTVEASSPLEAIEQVLGQTVTLNDELSERQQLRQLGQDVLEIAALGGMPDTYFMTDRRIKRACDAMGMSVSQGYQWMQHL